LPAPADGHGAHAQLSADLAEALALEDGEPDHCGMAGREPIEQLLQRLLIALVLLLPLGLPLGLLRRGELIDPEIPAGRGLMQAAVTPGVGAFFVLPPRHSHDAAVIAKVVEQRASDAPPEIGSGACAGAGIDGAAGKPELHLGDLPRIIELEDGVGFASEISGDGISQRPELLKQSFHLSAGGGHGRIAKDASTTPPTQEGAS